MPSTDSTEMTVQIIKADGHYAYSPQEVESLYDSPYCLGTTTLWHRLSGLTEAGKQLLAGTFHLQEDGCFDFTKCCVVTGKVRTVRVNQGAFLDWRGGTGCIQQVMPGMPAPEREFLISGTSPEGWNQLFKEEE